MVYHRDCPCRLDGYCKGEGRWDTWPSFGGLSVAITITRAQELGRT